MMDKKASIYMALGFESIGLIMGGLFLGSWLDNRYSWNGLGAVGGAMVGLVAWVTHLLIVVQHLAKTEETDNNSKQ